MLLGVLHRAVRLLQVGFRSRVLQPLGELVRLLDRAFLRLFQHLGVFGELRGRLARRLAPDEFPGAVDDLLLQFRQPVASLGIALLALLLFVLGRAARGLFALAEDLLERPDFGEEHVAGRPPRLAVRADILGPEKIGEKLVGRGLERLEVEHVLGRNWRVLAAAFGRTISRARGPPCCS